MDGLTDGWVWKIDQRMDGWVVQWTIGKVNMNTKWLGESKER